MKNMRLLIIAFAVAILLSAMLLPATAVYEPVEAFIHFEVKGNLPSEKCMFRLEAISSDAPLPVKGEKEVVGDGSESFRIDGLARPGVYSYRLYQIKGTNEKCVYDDTVYMISVIVSNGPAEKLVVNYTIEQGESVAEKENEVIFRNSYPDNPKTGDDNASSKWDIYLTVASAVIIACAIALIAIWIKSKKRSSSN